MINIANTYVQLIHIRCFHVTFTTGKFITDCEKDSAKEYFRNPMKYSDRLMKDIAERFYYHFCNRLV